MGGTGTPSTAPLLHPHLVLSLPSAGSALTWTTSSLPPPPRPVFPQRQGAPQPHVYRTNLMKESIHMGYNDLSDFHYAHGHLSEALKSYIRACDYCNTSKHVVQMCMNLILVSIELGQFTHVSNYVKKAEHTLDNIDHVTVSKLRVAAGLAYMKTTSTNFQLKGSIKQRCLGCSLSGVHIILMKYLTEPSYVGPFGGVISIS